MNFITAKIGNWMNDKMNDMDDSKHPILRAIGLGAMDGWIVGSVLMYPIVLIGCYYWRKKAEEK